MKRLLLTLLIFFVAGDFAWGQATPVASNIWGDTIVQTSIVKVKNRKERVEQLCKRFEVGASGGVALPRIYNNDVWSNPVVNSPYFNKLKYRTGGIFSASVGYHYWHLSLSATYTYISELSYRYGPLGYLGYKDVVYYFAKPMHLWGLSADFNTKYGVYGGVNSAYIHYDYGDRYMPRKIPFPIPNEPSGVIRAVTVGVHVGYTYTFYKGLGANAEVGINHIPLKYTNVKLFYFPLTMGIRYRFQG